MMIKSFGKIKQILFCTFVGIAIIIFLNRTSNRQSVVILKNLNNITSNKWDFNKKPAVLEFQTSFPLHRSFLSEPPIQKSTPKILTNFSSTISEALNQVWPLPLTTASAKIVPAKKVILFWNKWFDSEWIMRFPDQETLEEDNCPSFRCEFTYDQQRLPEADAVLVSTMSKYKDLTANQFYAPSQRWISVDVEAPTNVRPIFNWSMTYHSNADIVAFYGYFTPINLTVRSIRPNMMEYESETMKLYLKDLNATLESGSFPNEHPGPILDEYPGFSTKNRLAAWMSGHCPTDSRREKLIQILQKEIEIDTFGSCGQKSCGKRAPYDPQCWKEVLAPNYIFYFAMENILCDEYISEKLYNPLKYGLIPVVYGGSNYSQFLPPHSYIDATKYTPRKLAEKMLRVQKDQNLYSRYHLWRKYWKVHIGGSFCELCHRLHTDTEIKEIDTFRKFRRRNEKCYPPKI